MRTLTLSRHAPSVCAAAFVLAACGGSQTPSTDNASFVPVTISSSHLANGVSNDLARDSRLFVANSGISQIIIYPAGVHDPQPIGSISSGVYKPYNLAVDQKGTLYVANSNNTITEYRRGQTIASKTLTEPSGSVTATSLTVGSDGTVYAGNTVGEVFEFADGNTKPTKTLGVPASVVWSLALDSKNDLFVPWAQIFNGSGVVKYKPSSKVYKTVLSGESGILAVDLHDDLLLGDEGGIAIYKPGSKTPFRTIHRAGKKAATQFAFDSDEKYLYLASVDVGKVYVYDYETGKLAWIDRLGFDPTGAAIWPAAPQ
jgi:hypothetical protein